MQDYKSLCAAVVICSTLVNIQTHTHTDRQQLTRLFDKLSSVIFVLIYFLVSVLVLVFQLFFSFSFVLVFIIF